ncbi:MAG: Na+/H+ antiporter NhaC family protein [Anaerovoracaceae bacterium]|jgi:tetracycline resistance efflux pump
MDVGFLSVVPPLLTIALAIITKEVLLSLCIGVYTGCMIIAEWNPLRALETLVNILVGGYDETGEYVISGCLTDPWNVEVLLICIMLGGLIGLLIRSGASQAFGNLISSKVKTQKGAQVTTWLIGILIFFDDYFNALTNGAIMRPVTDRYGISREKLSYIVDSTSVGICLIVPLSSWVAFIASLIAGAYSDVGIEEDAFMAFLKVIPYNYYAWLSIIMVLVVALLKLDFGPMAKAEKRTRETGLLCDKTFSGGDADEDDFSSIPVSDKGKSLDLLAPIILLIILAMIFMLYTGGFFATFDLMETLNNLDGMLALVYAISISVVFSIIFYKIRGLSKITESIAAFVTGTKSMLFVVILLAFAWGIGSVCGELGTAEYVATLFVGSVPGWIVPFILFVFACVMTFSTGASWGTFAIMIPIAVPLAVAMDINIYACIATVIGGGGFGNHCSPLADTAILSSASSNIRHTDHIKTQIPYSLTCAAAASVGYIVSGFIDGWILPMLVTLGVFFAAVVVLARTFGEKRYSSEEIAKEAEASGEC